MPKRSKTSAKSKAAGGKSGESAARGTRKTKAGTAASKKKAAPAKTSAAKKAAPKKPAAKKTVPKKPAAKKPVAKKFIAKKSTAKTAPAKKAPAKKAAPAKAVPKAPASPKKTRTPKGGKRVGVKLTPAAVRGAQEAVAAMESVDTAAMIGLTTPELKDLPPVKFAKRDFKAITHALESIRGQLNDDLDALTENNLAHSGREFSGDLSGYGFHMADVATDNFARDMELNIATGETDRLRLVEEALDRVADGSFGRCVSCTEPIGVARLKVIPYTRRCIRCAEDAERR